MTADFDVRKTYSAVERMEPCEYSLEIIIGPLKEHDKHTNPERIAQANNGWQQDLSSK